MLVALWLFYENWCKDVGKITEIEFCNYASNQNDIKITYLFRLALWKEELFFTGSLLRKTTIFLFDAIYE